MNTSGNPQPNDGTSRPGNSGTPAADAAALRRKWWTAAGTIVAVLAVGGAVWASSQTGTRPTAVQQTSQQTSASASASAPSPATAASTPAASTPPAPAPTGEAPAAPAPPAPPAPPSPAADPVNPAPVDRTGKSDEELATIEQPVAAPVPLVEKKEVKSGVSATITELQAVQGEATGIGEIAGPAIRFKVTVTNNTAAEIPLDTALINVTFGQDNEPASALSGPDVSAFPAVVAPGTSASAVYVFNVPTEARGLVRIYFNLDAGTPIATFEGQAPA